MGELEPSSGHVVKVTAKGGVLKSVLLHQEFAEELKENNTLLEELFSVFKTELDIFGEKSRLENRLANQVLSSEVTRELLDEVKRLERLICNVNMFALKGKVEKVMNRMG